MKIKQTLFILLCTLASGLAAVTASQWPVAAQTKCGQVNTAIISGPVCDSKGDAKNPQDNAIWKLLVMVIGIMTAGVGILAVGGIVYASILYTTARDTPDQAEKARKLIWNIVIGLIMYGTMYLLLNFLVPGGIFS